MSLTNPSFETAGLTQGSADGWTLTTGTGATGLAAIEAGDGLLYAWESFSGWVSGQAEYRSAYEAGDTSPGDLGTETFGEWLATQVDYRAAFLDGDTSAGTLGTETFAAWISGQEDYQPDGFTGGDTSAGGLGTETFATWIAGQGGYRSAFGGGDTSAGTFQEGPGTTSGTESFSACRSDVAVQAAASSTTIAAAGHDFSVGDPVQLLADGSLFTPFQKGITYWVKTVVPGVSLTLAATAGGSAITATATGEATMIGDEAYFWRNPVSAW